jgi:hypothetical protein
MKQPPEGSIGNGCSILKHGYAPYAFVRLWDAVFRAGHQPAYTSTTKITAPENKNPAIVSRVNYIGITAFQPENVGE